MIDLILWANTKADLRTFAINRGLLVDGFDREGNAAKVNREGFMYDWWAGSGKFMTAKRTERQTAKVGQANATQCAFDLGAQRPGWLVSGVELVRDGETIADFDRIQGDWAVFTLRSGVTVTAGESVTAWSPARYATGFVALIRITGEFFKQDQEKPADDDPDREKQRARSKVAKAVFNNGTLSPIEGMDAYLWDGVRIFEATDVMDWLAARGLPRHEFLGGNRY